jgi:RNA polymerase sigma factor (sigma-70 family)
MTPIPLLSPEEVEADAWRSAATNVRLVARIAGCYPGRGLDRDDLIQEGLIGIYRGAFAFDPARGRRTAYLGDCARRAMLDAIRDRGGIVRFSLRALRARRAGKVLPGRDDGRQLDGVADPTPWREAVDDRLECEELMGRLHAMLARLDPRNRRIVLARDLEGRSFREIGRLVGLSPERACNLHRESVAKLRAMVA